MKHTAGGGQRLDINAILGICCRITGLACCKTLQNEASKHAAAAHLVAHRKILAVLRAPADSAVQALVDVAVPLVRAVAAVVAAVAEAPLGDAAAVGAHEEGAVAQASWREESERASQ